MKKWIDKTPPRMTGDAQQDCQALANYLAYLQEQINFLLSGVAKALEKEGEHGNEKE